MYLVTRHADLPIITQLNRSSILVSIVAVTAEQHVTKPSSYLDLYRATLEPYSPSTNLDEVGLPIFFDIVAQQVPWPQKLEAYISLFQILLVPTREVVGLGTSPFFYFVG